MKQEKSEIRDGMQLDWDVPIPMDDGVIMRADVFRPMGGGRYPVIMRVAYLDEDDYGESWKRETKDLAETLKRIGRKE